ncbi:MAG: NAD(+) diphosphatase [Clostridia bacterium]|nr:NAD(+) diphosphatase [Clostridia bacterium]
MTIDSIYKRYIPAFMPPVETKGEAFWFLFDSGKMLVKPEDNGYTLPIYRNLEGIGLKTLRILFLGEFDGLPCYSAEVDSQLKAPEGMEYRDLRSLFGMIEDDTFLLAGRASQLLHWDSTHSYCGRCGNVTETKSDERAKICKGCGLVSYPRISPAIIVAVVKEKKLLLAHSAHFPGGLYSVIAGFVEPGETFEECVKREVMEEVGIRIANPKYFGSQPWPFPDSLMVAFTAEYESGDIKVDGKEISDAGWYGKDELPHVPSRMSIGGRLINWFKENY